MQKKLADYFRLLIERRDDLLTEFYETGALMLADEAIVIMGLLVGLNVIDCNLCVKEEDLDSQMGVIDFSLYLRNTGADTSPDDSPEQSDMTTVLDQKNYIEELNRHLNATVTNLQAKMETLITTNALMKEDLSIAKNTIRHMQDDNDKLRKDKGLPTQQQLEQMEKDAKKASRVSVIGCEEEMQDLKLQLQEESAHRRQVEKELELQIQMKAESEMAAKLLEKDIHEKQDTIINLREQLDEIKVINLEMYRKQHEALVSVRPVHFLKQISLGDIPWISRRTQTIHGECENSLKQKTELIGGLEAKAAEMAETIRKLETQYVLPGPQSCLTEPPGQRSRPQSYNGAPSHGPREAELHTSRLWLILVFKLQHSGSSLVIKLQDGGSSLVIKLHAGAHLGKLHGSSLVIKLQHRVAHPLYEECVTQKDAAKTTALKLSDKVCDGELQSSSLETDLKIEREWRQSLQETLVKDREIKAELQHQLKELTRQQQDYQILKGAHVQLIGTVENQERTLEELGAHLSESKLKMADLRDVSKSLREAQWAPDKEATHCRLCEKEFSIARRRHHCRHCGNIFCHSCSDNTMPLPSSARPVRVCDTCHTQLLQRYSNSEI
ncbi:RUN and FYVE domain-containing protein 2 [Chionoecetes opilio]|uniref:RUN and FYVE domain-containing protein 2 n=1 Tax=Chionoecetes opilio TaxID=41210 RepID=A0A8J4Y0S5_CHIOP|nr:RUN and FYVE domain-containing protein 2 [Chionoecetes opilio]